MKYRKILLLPMLQFQSLKQSNSKEPVNATTAHGRKCGCYREQTNPIKLVLSHLKNKQTILKIVCLFLLAIFEHIKK